MTAFALYPLSMETKISKLMNFLLLKLLLQVLTQSRLIKNLNTFVGYAQGEVEVHPVGG
jgi:hypothetical protein